MFYYSMFTELLLEVDNVCLSYSLDFGVKHLAALSLILSPLTPRVDVFVMLATTGQWSTNSGSNGKYAVAVTSNSSDTHMPSITTVPLM